MIKQLFGAILGIDADEYDSEESQTEWERRRYLDENDLDDDDDSDDDSQEDTDSNNRWWIW